jgi:N-acetylneuraminate synthase
MFIGEIGINHNGKVNLAKKMIKMAKEAGVDIVKFQKRNPDKCVPEHKKDDLRDTPWGTMKYINYKKKIEFNKEEYDIIDKYCKKLNIKWTASVWDLDSLKFIMQYNVPFIKIASACITNYELLNEIKKYNIPIVMSTGMSTIEEIKKAVNILKDKKLTILHCNSNYPSKNNELDLNIIKTLKKMFPNYKIGYSGHEKGIQPTILAKSLGAEVIERHITLDKNMWGSDQKASLEYKELNKLINILNKVNIWLGDNSIKVYPSEVKMRNKLRNR